jgi:hypothetical protein
VESKAKHVPIVVRFVRCILPLAQGKMVRLVFDVGSDDARGRGDRAEEAGAGGPARLGIERGSPWPVRISSTHFGIATAACNDNKSCRIAILSTGISLCCLSLTLRRAAGCATPNTACDVEADKRIATRPQPPLRQKLAIAIVY